MNAARRFAAQLPREAVVRLLGRRAGRFDPPFPADTALDRGAGLDELRDRLGRRHEDELTGLLNALADAELRGLAAAEGVAAPADVGALRAALWRHGARLEAGGDRWLGTPLQRVPTVLAGRLHHLAPPRGLAPAAAALPRPVPPVAVAAPPDDEPEALDELLAAADRALGVRLPGRGAHKGAWGGDAARLLGVVERGAGEPDWRGDVEIKTVPVRRDPGGLWQVTEDPAVAMLDGRPLAKLQRVLWLARASLPGGEATFVSWYLLDWDGELARLVARYLHTRPKGAAGTSGRGWYLHKRFFADAGLLGSLNGIAA